MANSLQDMLAKYGGQKQDAKRGALFPTKAPSLDVLGRTFSPLGQALNWSHAASQEAIFHGGDEDTNRRKLRETIPDIFNFSPNEPQTLQTEYEQSPHFMQGLTDVALDTLTDPWTHGGARVLEDLGYLASGAYRHAAQAFPAVRGAGEAMTKLFTYGGEAAVKHGRPAVEHSVGVKSYGESRRVELERRLQKQIEAATAHLTPEQKTETLQALNGERDPAHLTQPAQLAHAAVKRTLRDVATLEATPAGKWRLGLQEGGLGPRLPGAKQVVTPGAPAEAADVLAGRESSDKLAQDWRQEYLRRAIAALPGGAEEYRAMNPAQKYAHLTTQGMTKHNAQELTGAVTPDMFDDILSGMSGAEVERAFKPYKKGTARLKPAQADLWRAQKTPGVPEVSPRGGTFYNTNEQLAQTYAKHADFTGRAGKNIIPMRAAAKNPFQLAVTPGEAGSMGQMALRRLSPQLHAQLTSTLATNDTEALQRFMVAQGVSEADLPALMSQAQAEGGDMLPLFDRVAAQEARRQGYDAIVTPHEQFILDPAAAKPAHRGIADVVKPQVHPELAEFGQRLGGGTVSGTLGPSNLRKKYLTMPHPSTVVDPKNRPEQPTYNLLGANNPFAKQRETFQVGDTPAEVERLMEALRGRASGAARNVSSAEMSDLMHKQFGKQIPMELEKLFDVERPATGKFRTPVQQAGAAWRGLVSLPKQAVVGVLPRHIVNIANLGVANKVDVGKAAHVARDLVRNPENQYELLKQGIQLGAISPTAQERELPLAGILGKLGMPGQKIGDYMRSVNRTTWAFDDAMKQQLAIQNAAQGQKGFEAGRNAVKAMIDYEHTSPLTNAAKNVMPFATFNTQLYPAVLKAIARDPKRALLIDRLTNGMYLGGTANVNGHDVSMNNPTADVGRLDQKKFLRKSLSSAVDIPLSGVMGDPFWTYGENVRDPKELVQALVGLASNGIPEARDILQEAGYGTFAPRGILQQLGQSATGVNVR